MIQQSKETMYNDKYNNADSSILSEHQTYETFFGNLEQPKNYYYEENVALLKVNF